MNTIKSFIIFLAYFLGLMFSGPVNAGDTAVFDGETLSAITPASFSAYAPLRYSDAGGVTWQSGTAVSSSDSECLKPGHHYSAIKKINSTFLSWPRFVVVGDKGRICFSNDGKAWQLSTNSNENDLYDVVYGEVEKQGEKHGLLVAVGAQGTLLTWTTRSLNRAWQDQTPKRGAAGSLNSIVFGNGIFVAAGDVFTIWNSTDFLWNPEFGKNSWESGDGLSGGRATFNRVIFVKDSNSSDSKVKNGAFIAAADSGTIMYSDSTLNDNSQLSWSYAPVPSGDNTGYVDIAYAPAPPPKPDKNSYGTFVAVGKGYENNGYVARACISTNVGTPWRHVLIEPSVYRFPHRIIYSPENNTFLALLNSSNGRYGHVYYSNDGNTWAHATLNNTSGKPTSNELDLSTIVTTKGSQLIALPSAAPTSGFDCAYALSTCTVQSPDCMTSWKAVANWGITSSYCP